MSAEASVAVELALPLLILLPPLRREDRSGMLEPLLREERSGVLELLLREEKSDMLELPLSDERLPPEKRSLKLRFS